MKQPYLNAMLALGLALTFTSGCSSTDKSTAEQAGAVTAAADSVHQAGNQPVLEEVARSDRQWVGVAVSDADRKFVCWPNWNPKHTVSVAALEGSTPVPFPNAAWNTWDSTRMKNAVYNAAHFICVQSVFMGPDKHLWILDPANVQRNMKFMGVAPGGAKLLKVNPATGEVLRTYAFKAPAIKDSSYLNDVRIDPAGDYAYMTDSNAPGLVVLDLKTGAARRVLDNHPSTRSEKTPVVIDGVQWKKPNGQPAEMQADGIALHDGWLYYQAISGVTLYRVPTDVLKDSKADAAGKVETVGKFYPVDGMLFGPDGKLYRTDLTNKAISRYTPGATGSEKVLTSPDLHWPDTYATGPGGYLYVTTSKIHLKKPGANPAPYQLFRVKLFE